MLDYMDANKIRDFYGNVPREEESKSEISVIMMRPDDNYTPLKPDQVREDEVQSQKTDQVRSRKDDDTASNFEALEDMFSPFKD